MAQIPIERKSSASWLWWIIALIIIALLLWWLLGSRRDRGVVGGDVATPAAVAPDTAGPTAGTTAGTTTGAGVGGRAGDFLTWVDQSRASTAAGPDHEWVATGITRLAGAIGDIASRDSLAGSAVSQQVQALDQLAQQVQQDSAALTHADVIRSAFESSATLLGDIQQRRFPGAAGAVADVRQAAGAIDKSQPLLQQKPQMERFFEQAATAVRAMGGAR